MDDKLLNDIFSKRQEVPDELKMRIHAELIKREKKIIARNITLSLAAVLVLSFFVISLAVIFLGDIVSLLLTSAGSAVCAFMAVILAVAAGKYKIADIKKGL